MGGKGSYAQLYAKTAGITFKKFGKPTKVTLSRSKAFTMKVGDKVQLVATLSPVNADSKLTWSSSKKAVAGVSSKGVVTTKKAGKTTVKVKTANGKTAKVTITVNK
ncbi:MAG: Ig-like domain-containing protein [Oscillospiraceae bacterium]|nr:Ig-like domain-containing protein [Oscillospiraceae bacterium]